MALNAERAEEEKKGLVRWLRPEFQNPGGKAVTTQFTMTGTEARPEGEEPAAESARTWPKKVAEQIAAVRDLLLRSTSTWSEAEVQGAFKGAKRKEVAAALETLVALGIGVSYSGKDEVRYRAAGRAVA